MTSSPTINGDHINHLMSPDWPKAHAGDCDPCARASSPTPRFKIGDVILGNQWADLPHETLLVDAWGVAYRVGWKFMNREARTVVRYNTAGQGRPEVYDLDEVPPATADAQLRIVFLGR